MSRDGNNIISYDGSRRVSARDNRVVAGARNSHVSYRRSSAYLTSARAVGQTSVPRGLGYDEPLSPLRSNPYSAHGRSGLSKVSRSGRISPVETFDYDDNQAKQAASSRVSTRRASSHGAAGRRASLDFAAFSAFDDLDAQLNGAGGANRAANKVHVSTEPRAAVETFEASEDEGALESRKSKKQRQKKQRAKAKADKMFSRQFAGSDQVPEGSSSRAAVYKGEMGKNHKRAFADLGGFASRDASDKRKTKKSASPLGSVLRWRFAPAVIAVLGVAVVAAFAVVMLFPTAQQYYLASRTQDKLQAEYDAVSQRNAAIQSDIDYLSTDEGIADAAREQLGWVASGETAGVVTGLSSDDSTTKETVYAQVDSSSVETPTTWYSDFLDPIFGYQG